MNEQKRHAAGPSIAVEHVTSLSPADMHDLCDATDSAIEAGGGFGWVSLPARDILERYWQGVMTIPQRLLFVARLDGVVCGAIQAVMPPKNNEAQSFALNLTAHFVAPWARGYGLARLLVATAEKEAIRAGFSIANLDVRETQTAAIQLYESMGYQMIGEHPFYARVNGEIIKGRYYYKKLA